MEMQKIDSNLEQYKEKVLNYLRTSETPVDITFSKADGSYRHMKATLNPALINSTYEKKTDRTREPNPDVQYVFDTEKDEFRNFRWDKLMEVRFP